MTQKQAVHAIDVEVIRRRAREHIENGAITATYGADRDAVLKMLNDALASELVCALRYKRHYFMAQGIHREAIAEEFLEHANQEARHADRIAARIVQLGGEPDFNPSTLATRSHSEYVEGKTLLDMIREDLVAERVAIDSYSAIIRFVEDGDPTTRRLMEEILAVEEEHAEDMISLLRHVGAETALRPPKAA